MQKMVSAFFKNNKIFIAILLLIALVVVVVVASIMSSTGKTALTASPSMESSIEGDSPQLAYFPTPSPGSPMPSATLITRTATLVPTATPTIRLTPTATPIPESVYLTIDAHAKYFYLGCEAAAAVDLAEYYNVLIYQYDFQQKLPLSDNPDLGFVGDVNGPWGQVPPYAYGVHAAPVAELLQTYGVDVEGGKGYTLEQVKKQIAAGNPVIVWVIGNMVGGVPANYTDSNGNTTIVAAYEHVVILTGYDSDSVRYVNNGRFYEVPNEVFLNSWGVLGNMAIFHK